MRSLAVLAVLAACTRGHGEPRFITIGTDALATAHAVADRDHARLELVAASHGVAILEVDPNELDALSDQMHVDHERCGGFMVHDSLADARAELADPPRERRVDYTIDRAAVVRDVMPAVDRARILATIRELSAMPNRYYQSESGAAASRWLRDRWLSFTTRTDVTAELFDQGYAQKTVVLTIPGTTRANEVVVIGGHLDSIAPGGRASVAPGADDDASGIATLTEVARVLLAADVRTERTIKLIGYAAEEVGLRGSLALVKEFKRRGIDVVGALQLDMTNYQGSDTDIWLMNDYTSADQNAFVGRLIDTYVGASWAYDACGYACSDHAAWHRAGVPASMPFEAASRDRNRAIHTKRDTLEISGDNADHAVKFARLATAYAVELAKGSLGEAPRVHAAEPADRTALAVLALISALALAFGVRHFAARDVG